MFCLVSDNSRNSKGSQPAPHLGGVLVDGVLCEGVRDKQSYLEIIQANEKDLQTAVAMMRVPRNDQLRTK